MQARAAEGCKSGQSVGARHKASAADARAWIRPLALSFERPFLGAIRTVFNFLSQVIACWMMWQLLPRLAEILLCTDPSLGDHELLVWFSPAGISSRTPVLGVVALPKPCTVPDTQGKKWL